MITPQIGRFVVAHAWHNSKDKCHTAFIPPNVAVLMKMMAKLYEWNILEKNQSTNDIYVLIDGQKYIFFTNKQFMLCKIYLTDFYFIKMNIFLRNKYLHIYLLPWSWKAVRWSVPIEWVYIVACSIFSLKVVVKVIVQKSTQTRCLRQVGDGRVNFNIYKPTYTSLAVKHNLYKCACWQNYLKCLKHAILSK